MDWSMFWASVFPAYLGAVGSIAASAVAVIAFLRDIRTRKGLNEVAQSSSTTTDAPTNEPSIVPRLGTSDQTQPLELVAHGSQTAIRNLTEHPIEIVDIRVPSGGKTITLRSEFPGVVQPGEGFGLIVHDLLGGPAIAAMLVEWRGVGGQLRLTKFFV
ncbi:hypothetical protein [Microbacterium sp. P03]|uniref:hypothetical protein n=1 Tax=Microbacterium sp. P03 TaxID=3366946 RepID=UPI00374768B7